MKVQNITDIEKFFKVVDECKGKVELVTGEDRKGISFLRCKMFLGIKVILCYTNAHRGDRVKEDWRERCCKETFLSKESRWPDVG